MLYLRSCVIDWLAEFAAEICAADNYEKQEAEEFIFLLAQAYAHLACPIFISVAFTICKHLLDANELRLCRPLVCSPNAAKVELGSGAENGISYSCKTTTS
jgi:hypothetical protein